MIVTSSVVVILNNCNVFQYILHLFKSLSRIMVNCGNMIFAKHVCLVLEKQLPLYIHTDSKFRRPNFRPGLNV